MPSVTSGTGMQSCWRAYFGRDAVTIPHPATPPLLERNHPAPFRLAQGHDLLLRTCFDPVLAVERSHLAPALCIRAPMPPRPPLTEYQVAVCFGSRQRSPVPAVKGQIGRASCRE